MRHRSAPRPDNDSRHCEPNPGGPGRRRNAGGVVTDDVLRSLTISQRLLGTEEIVLIHHTDCGMLTFRDDDFKDQIQSDTGLRPRWAPESFPEPEVDVRQSIARVESDPFLLHSTAVRGFVYDVSTGELREVQREE
ncbi:beta-class carbonic anhydrase [Dietzia massiliensis]|uniref:beta-class carbonic anhydrase n=1 Tax=Dietzia massiliensis TaxID=2697499 RepID=UPI001BCEB3ED|nr:carbonic anhydrase [Dietzia massiliensis]MBS7548798.1 carbonic anhydrase [Dietzia massiliensis]